jgi:hypothetical protein
LQIATSSLPEHHHNLTFFNLKALETTEMDESAIAAAAIAGLSKKPVKG